MSRPVVLSSITALACLLAVQLHAAGADPSTATESLRSTFLEANRIITDPTTAEQPLERLNAVRLLVGVNQISAAKP